MTFRIFKNSTTADASDSNDNFYHIGQGSILPQAGTLLANTTGANDLGSSTYKWNLGYFSSISSDALESQGLTWDHVLTTTLDATATNIDISGLNSDDDMSYLIYYFIVNPTSTVNTVSFGLGSASSFLPINSGRIVYASGTGAGFTSGAGNVFNSSAPTDTALYSFGYWELSAETSLMKLMAGVCVTDVGEKVSGRVHSTFNYAGSTRGVTVTSLSLVCSTGSLEPGTSISIFKKGV